MASATETAARQKAARLAPPAAEAIVRLPQRDRPILLVVIDTEEEFDWGAGFDRSRRSVGHLRGIERLQEVFDAFGIRPTYVVDHPVATHPDGAEPLRAIHASGRAEIGAHLHPWVSPPFEEEVSPFHSYPGNLPADLERAKLAALTDAIERGIGVRPLSYKAGRYGFGSNTAGILADLGFRVDLSPCPPFDFAEDGGPDYTAFPVEPFWLDRAGPASILCVPVTGAYVGFVRSTLAHRLYSLAARPALSRARLPGILSRLGAVERLMLSPEGYEPRHHRRITQALLERGVRTFTFSLHSPSIQPGCTPYVRTQGDLVQFLDACRRYFEFFLGELGGASMTALELRDHILADQEPAS